MPSDSEAVVKLLLLQQTLNAQAGPQETAMVLDDPETTRREQGAKPEHCHARRVASAGWIGGAKDQIRLEGDSRAAFASALNLDRHIPSVFVPALAPSASSRLLLQRVSGAMRPRKRAEGGVRTDGGREGGESGGRQGGAGEGRERDPLPGSSRWRAETEALETEKEAVKPLPGSPAPPPARPCPRSQHPPHVNTQPTRRPAGTPSSTCSTHHPHTRSEPSVNLSSGTGTRPTDEGGVRVGR